MIRLSLWMGLLLTVIFLSTGCVNVDAKAPKDLWGSPPPSASIAQADPDSRTDLLRENRQLRDRLDWLQHENSKSANKLHDLQRKEADLRADMEKIATERDLYKHDAGY